MRQEVHRHTCSFKAGARLHGDFGRGPSRFRFFVGAADREMFLGVRLLDHVRCSPAAARAAEAGNLR